MYRICSYFVNTCSCIHVYTHFCTYTRIMETERGGGKVGERKKTEINSICTKILTIVLSEW